MITPSYGFDAGKVAGQKLRATEVNYLFRVIDSQLNGALGAIGPGVLVDNLESAENATDLKVTADGSSLAIGAGAAICRETTNNIGFVHARFGTEQTISLDELEEGDNFIYVVPRFATSNVLLDSRQGDEPVIMVHGDELEASGDGALLLALVPVQGGVIGTVVDRREFISTVAILRRVIQLEADLGYGAAERVKGTVAARLNAFSGDEGEGTVITFLSQLKYSEADPRNAVVVIEAKLAENLAAAKELAEAGGQRETTLETDKIWEWLFGIRRIIGMLAPSLLRFMPGAGAQPGLHGTESAPDTVQHDLGGTLPAVPSEREYDSR